MYRHLLSVEERENFRHNAIIQTESDSPAVIASHFKPIIEQDIEFAKIGLESFSKNELDNYQSSLLLSAGNGIITSIDYDLENLSNGYCDEKFAFNSICDSICNYIGFMRLVNRSSSIPSLLLCACVGNSIWFNFNNNILRCVGINPDDNLSTSDDVYEFSSEILEIVKTKGTTQVKDFYSLILSFIEKFKIVDE